jgi:hypothetical protein
LVCHAGHAQLDPTIGRQKTRGLLRACRRSVGASTLRIAASP